MDRAGFRLLIDTPATNPALGYGKYAEAFAEIIEKSKPQFAIGIFGSWGTGKTTLMDVIRHKLEMKQILCVEFSAWRYQKEDHLIIPLLAAVKDALEQRGSNAYPSAADVVMDTAKTLGAVVKSLVAGVAFKVGLPGAMEVSFDATKALAEAKASGNTPTPQSDTKQLTSVYYACFAALKKAFDSLLAENPGWRIVVFVDDLDRCFPNSILQTLESMKLFFDLAGFVFVVGVDSAVVERCIDLEYRQRGENHNGDNQTLQIRGSDYLKKIFQVPFSLFPVSLNEIGRFLENMADENALPCDQRNEILRRVRPHLDYLMGDSGLNPREIKRFINAYTLNMKLKPNLNEDAVLALQTISFREDWQSVQEGLYGYADDYLDALRAQLGGDGNGIKNLDPVLSVPASFLVYASENAPGNAIFSALPVDEYIRSGAAVSSTSNVTMTAPLRNLRPMISRTYDENGARECMGRGMSLVEEIQPRGSKNSPFWTQAVSEFRSFFEQGPPDFKSGDAVDEWKRRYNEIVSAMIKALVRTGKSGERAS